MSSSNSTHDLLYPKLSLVYFLMYDTLYRPLVLPKQLLVKGYSGWFAISFQAVVKAGIWNLARVPAIARLLFEKDTKGSLTSTH